MVAKSVSLLLFCNSKEAQLISAAVVQVILLPLLSAVAINRINATGKAVNSPPVMSEKEEALAKTNSLVLVLVEEAAKGTLALVRTFV